MEYTKKFDQVGSTMNQYNQMFEKLKTELESVILIWLKLL